MLALATGLRQSEALALAWPQIDLDAGTMAIRQSMSRARYLHGCGRPPTCGMRPVDCPQRTGHGPELSDVQSRAGKRVVTLPAPLVVALRAHRTAQLEERLAAGSLWWTTAASLLLLLTVPARVVMDILGHSSYQLTMNTYSHVAPELNSEAARLMSGALWEDEAADKDAPQRQSGD